MNTGIAPARIAKSQIISLAEADITEAALEKLIADDPVILGLGDVVLIERQRPQERAGRLDLLLEDADGETRYEVELNLGSLDESHLVRAIEYWDVERRHYPGYEHRAVIVAEDITSRFLNVIQLFSGSVPIIALQANCIKVGDLLTVNFIKLVDSAKLRRDDHLNATAKATDRNYWLTRVGQTILGMADECVGMINQVAKRKRSLNFNKGFVGLTDGTQSNNFVLFLPRKSFLRLRAAVNPVEPWGKRLEQSSLDFKLRDDDVLVSVTPQAFEENKSLLRELLQQSVKEDES